MHYLARLAKWQARQDDDNPGSNNLQLFILAALGGAFIGASVAFIRKIVGFFQTALFGVNVNELGAGNASNWRVLLIPLLGGLLLGLLLNFISRLGRLSIIDPVEANALEGGKMSMVDSLILVGLSMLSITIGGSVGFEAAMTQLGAGLLSTIGQRLRFGRRELRLLVSCGTGAGIAAIFGAPLAGAFYALELVVGGYAMRALMPTLLASAMSSLVIYLTIGYQPIFAARIVDKPSFWHFFMGLGIGICSALIGIAVMRGTTGFESLLKRAKIKNVYKPAIGGLLLGLTALLAPQVMGPGHHEINKILAGQDLTNLIVMLLLAKIIASIVCVGSGFRGGLFSASLYLGAALGYILHILLINPFFHASFPLDLSIVAAMAGVTTSIIGTPVAILLLMIETAGLTSGIFTITITVIIASQLTRHWFGYSFSTWRFHVRGSDILGPKDIGRFKALKFEDFPLKNLTKIQDNTSIANAIAIMDATESNYLAVTEQNGKFIGIIESQRLRAESNHKPPLLLCNLLESFKVVKGNDSIADFIDTINDQESVNLVVIDKQGELLGLIAEITILRRYLNEVLAAADDEVDVICKR